ncbi:hypothetical protein SAMN06295885_1632 [Rathayibacter oskolensis]|uniref:Short C-terminal domain-containing protein n=1 Tax=Rathayibacter oskolensis TaxID=1891671 RepID=A0A1X7NN25_9MICO|nr:SHOCT domain-containing protein [Rathayibacter oskolensis]SMH39356.1 hypothetical protein SAMN06295885_1632 [Rathayibacter oskolensis]
MHIVTNPGVPVFFGIVAAAVPLFVVAVIVLAIVLVVVNVRRAKKLGVNPLTLQTDVAARFVKDGVGGDRPLADRLAELEGLRAAGTITEAEYTAARSAALGS